VSMLEEGRVSGDQCGLGTEGRAQGERRMKVRTDVRVLVFLQTSCVLGQRPCLDAIKDQALHTLLSAGWHVQPEVETLNTRPLTLNR